jgi:hypothetical protein
MMTPKPNKNLQDNEEKKKGKDEDSEVNGRKNIKHLELRGVKAGGLAGRMSGMMSSSTFQSEQSLKPIV